MVRGKLFQVKKVFGNSEELFVSTYGLYFTCSLAQKAKEQWLIFLAKLARTKGGRVRRKGEANRL